MRIGMDISALPCPTFIKSSIEKIAAQHHSLHIFTQVKGDYTFMNRSIYIHKRPEKTIPTIIIFFQNLLKLLFKSPARAIHIWNHYSKLNFYSQIKEFNRIAPFYIHTLDVIHIQWLRSVVKLQYIIDYKPCPIVVSARGTQLLVSPLSEKDLAVKYKELLPKVDAIHVVSKALKNEAELYTSRPINIINDAIDSTVFPYKNIILNSEKTIQIITVSRFNWVKGLSVLVDAIYILKQKNISCKLTIVSSDKPNEEYIYQMHDLGLQQHIDIKNNLTQTEIYSELLKNKLFVLPSLSEGRSNALLEAMAVGLPVLCSNFKGAEELISNNINGLLFDSGDANHLAQSIEKYINLSQSEKMKIAENARQTIDELYTIEKQTNDFIHLYNHLVKH